MYVDYDLQRDSGFSQDAGIECWGSVCAVALLILRTEIGVVLVVGCMRAS
jgi:hypothetical protein